MCQSNCFPLSIVSHYWGNNIKSPIKLCDGRPQRWQTESITRQCIHPICIETRLLVDVAVENPKEIYCITYGCHARRRWLMKIKEIRISRPSCREEKLQRTSHEVWNGVGLDRQMIISNPSNYTPDRHPRVHICVLDINLIKMTSEQL